MKRRLLSLLLVIVMTFTMLATTTACDGNEGNGGENNGGGGDVQPMVDPTNDNYRTFYQIFVGSFSDANGDTFGDLRGIINRMDYLNDGDINSGKDLGVQGIWLSPIFSSPTYHKYDAKDYYKIDWRFGEEKDLVELVELCHERNVKIILDLAINHTSDQHEWFKQFSKARMEGDTSNKYYDYYTCVKESQKVGGRTYQKIAGVDAYFECNFSGSMPELNFDNPEVVEEMLNVARYYLDLGVDGFRFDAVKYIYLGDTNKSVAFWERYMNTLRSEYPDIYAVGECWSGDNEVLKYYKAFNCFNFTMSQAEGQVASAAKGTTISKYLNYVEKYQDNVHAANPNGMPINFITNHDVDRIAGTFITEGSLRMAASLYLLAPGSPIIYYGDEIGMRGSRGAALTDANRRLAMLWGDGDKVKNPEGSTYPDDKQVQTNVTEMLENPNSLVAHYAALNHIRIKYPAIARGDYNAITSTNKNFGGFYVEYQGETLGIFHNTSANAITIDLSKCYGLDGHSFTQLLEVVGMGEASFENGVLTIGGQTSIILK